MPRGRTQEERMRFATVSLLIGVMLLSFAVHASADEFILASTTSTENSGLFDYLLPVFEKKTGIKVKVVARGTGAALEMAKRGDADAVFVHAKDVELEAVRQGYFVDRHDVMYNDFILIGPSADPARVKGIASITEAFTRIAEASAGFVSRGDNSGTHIRELSIWAKLRIQPEGKDWYLQVGQGMEKTQRIANEKRAYTLTDRGTWLATKQKNNRGMVIVSEGDPLLFNQYGVMAVNPLVHAHARYRQAAVFIEWIVSSEGQKAIGSYRDSEGNQVFIPNAD
jgi:tungstate transport system substrate-binding protein